MICSSAPAVNADSVLPDLLRLNAHLVQENQSRHEQRMQTAGRLAANVAHDFNNLLFIILSYTEDLLSKDTLSPADRQAVTEIAKAGETAAKITGQLLTFSRKEPLSIQDLNVNKAIRDSEHLLRRMAGASVQWHLRLETNLRAVSADPGQFTQVLMNLIANARDAMKDGGKITIATANTNLPRPGIALSVTDSGSGMSAETAEHLFEPFYTTRERGKGTGLGLSIVQNIVTELGGTINVASQPGKGTSFTVYLPAAHPHARPQLTSEPVRRVAAARA